MKRRTLLRGAGAAIALPVLDAMTPSAFAKEADSPPACALFVYVPNGVNIAKWVPTSSGHDYQLSSTLRVLEPFRDDFTVMSGLGHPNSKGGHSGADTFLTGADLGGTPGFDYRNGMSVDQIAAEVVGLETRIPSLELSAAGGTGSPGHSHTLAFSRDAVPLPAESNPREVFRRLFIDDSPASRQARLQRFAEDKSILDSVLGQARQLNRQLGKQDQRKLDEYLSSVREVERRVKRAESWMDVPKPNVQDEHLRLDAEPEERGNRRDWERTMYDLAKMAFETDTTRVITLQLGREAAGGYFTELGLAANHHELSHHGGDATMLAGLQKIDQFHLKQLGHLLKTLSETEESGNRLIDRTMILYGSGMNSGTGGGHSPKNLPLLFAGGSRLGLKLGTHLSFEEGKTPFANVHLTMLRAMGLEQQQFVDSSGTLAGLS
ncbi:MAG: DUF1552 domain-containing protein [Planctomycetota bacterium]